MPSILLTAHTTVSGGYNLISGTAFWSGKPWPPTGGVQLKLSSQASGNAYVGLSGGVTIGSGGLAALSGAYLSGFLDGMELGPGQALFIPRIALGSSGGLIGASGGPGIFVACDPTCSGQARLFWEAF